MFNVIRPCHDCPFRKQNGIRLTEPRVLDIAGQMLSPDGSPFWCHKTTVSLEEIDDGCSTRGANHDTQHCAGALIFAEKNNNATQAMRIAERLGIYRRDVVMADDAITNEVCDTIEEMLKINGYTSPQPHDHRRRNHDAKPGQSQKHQPSPDVVLALRTALCTLPTSEADQTDDKAHHPTDRSETPPQD